MLFAHLPGGYLTALVFKKLGGLEQKFSSKQIKWFIGILLLFSIIPDFDLFYFYFFNASEVHREFFSHTPITYLGILAITGVMAIFCSQSKKLPRLQFVLYIGLSIFLGSTTHLLLDSIRTGVMWLWPFSTQLYGLTDLAFFRNLFEGKFAFLLNYGLEIIITAIAVNLFFQKHLSLRGASSSSEPRSNLLLNAHKLILSSSILFIIIILFLLYYISPHLYQAPSIHFLDDDLDGIENYQDLDIDGDGILNIRDDDADNDGIENKQDFLNALQYANKIWYDTLKGKFWNMGGRFGLIVCSDVIERSLAQAGIFLGEEMKQDFTLNFETYDTRDGNTPKNPYFPRRAKNIQQFFKNKESYLNPKYHKLRNIHPGDIIFFGDPAWHVAITTEVDEQGQILKVFEADPSHLETGEVNFKEVVERNGKMSGWAYLNFQ